MNRPAAPDDAPHSDRMESSMLQQRHQHPAEFIRLIDQVSNSKICSLSKFLHFFTTEQLTIHQKNTNRVALVVDDRRVVLLAVGTVDGGSGIAGTRRRNAIAASELQYVHSFATTTTKSYQDSSDQANRRGRAQVLRLHMFKKHARQIRCEKGIRT